MDQIILSQAQARKIILHAAGLSKRAQFGKGKEAVYKVIDHLGFVQIDTNYVVERAHHHSIASRVPDYKPKWLDELQVDGRIFEFWTSDTGYLPTYNYRFSLPVKESFLAKRKQLPSSEINLMKKILDRVGREGPVMAKDFENDRVTKSAGWWDWRPSKVALERLHLDGRLMTLRATNFQKVYDLPENIVPPDTDLTMPAKEEFVRHVIFRTLKAFGLAYWKEIAWKARFIIRNDETFKPAFESELRKMVDSGEVCSVRVQGVKGGSLYMLPSYKNKKINLSGETYILSPFDTLNVFRHRLREFFNFDYQIECFVPEAKRKYGYFSLPILVGDTFIARMDSKVDRKEGVLTIHNLHFEPGKRRKKVIKNLCEALDKFSKFNQCKTLVITKSNDKEALKIIRTYFGG